jgi:hypothetical protein
MRAGYTTSCGGLAGGVRRRAMASGEGGRSVHAIYTHLTPGGTEVAVVMPEYLARLEAVADAAHEAVRALLDVKSYPFEPTSAAQQFLQAMGEALDRLDHYKHD